MCVSYLFSLFVVCFCGMYVCACVVSFVLLSARFVLLFSFSLSIVECEYKCDCGRE